MTRTSDVSLLGWGATSNGVRTRGPWLPTELSPHQLPRATGGHSYSPDIRKGEIRDFNTYASGQLHSCCLFQQKGWIVSPMLSQLTKDLWLWCMKRNILLQAQHLPGVLNTVPDEESRTWLDRSEWMLSPTILMAY